MEYLVVCLVAVTVSALTLFSGFGLGTVLMPAFALFFPVPIAVAATAVVHLANNIFKVDLARLLVYGFTFYTAPFAVIGEVWGLVLAATLAAFLGAFIGTRLVKKVTLRAIQITVGVMLVAVGFGMTTGLF